MMQPGPGWPMSVPIHETAQNRRMIFCQILPRLVLNLHFKSYTLNLGVFFFAPNNSSYMQIFQLFLFVERVFDVYLFCDRCWTAPFGHWLAVPLEVRGNSQDRCVGRRRRSFFFFYSSLKRISLLGLVRIYTTTSFFSFCSSSLQFCFGFP
jgi:hypothetical protein